MVLTLNHSQFEAFSDEFEQRLRENFKRALIGGVGQDAVATHAGQLGLGSDEALNTLYTNCDMLGAVNLDSFLIHACIALEPASVQAANPNLFTWINRILARNTPVIDQWLGVIRKHLAATADMDPDAKRIHFHITACQGAKA